MSTPMLTGACSELKRERVWSRIHLTPLLLAETDRDSYRREKAMVAREKEIMKDVPGWEVRVPAGPRASPLTETGGQERVQLEPLHAADLRSHVSTQGCVGTARVRRQAVPRPASGSVGAAPGPLGSAPATRCPSGGPPVSGPVSGHVQHGPALRMGKGKKGRSRGATRGGPSRREQRHASKADPRLASAGSEPAPEARPENNAPAHGSDEQANSVAAPAEHSTPASTMPPLPVVEPTAEPDAVQDVSIDPRDTSVQRADPTEQEGADQQKDTEEDKERAVVGADGTNAEQPPASAPGAAGRSEPVSTDGPEAETRKADEEPEARDVEGSDGEASTSDRTTSSASISEPVFKYEILHGSVADILAQDSISALAVASERLAVGMHSGAIFVLRTDGTLERALHLHSAAVHDVVFDTSGETVGSAGMDGHVAITSLHSSEQYRFDFRRPMRALALDPQFGRRSTRAFVSGGLAGALVLREKGWFGHRETVLHSGEGPVWSIAWRSHWIAWANDGGVRIADARTRRLVARIPAPEDATRRDVARCTLSWGSDTSLLIAQGDQLTRVEMRMADVPAATDSTARPLAQFVPTLGPAGQAPSAHAEITDIFQLDSIVSGAAVWGPEELLVLAYADESETTLRPELRTISMQGEELDNDQLYLHSSPRFRYNDFHLRISMEQRQVPTKPAHVRPEPVFYVASPAQVIVGRPRDDRDHVEWLLAHRHFRAALEHLDALGPAASAALGFDAKAIGRQYLNSLLDTNEYEALAAALPGTLGGDTGAWEHYVFAMLERQQATVLLPYLPTGAPQLGEVMYDMVLVQLLHRDAHLLLDTLRHWPVQLYSTQAVAAAIEDACATRRRRDTSAEDDVPLLLEALAQLYLANRQPGKALQYLLRLRRKEVFDLVREQNLFTAVQDRVAELVELEEHVRASAASDDATASPGAGPGGSAVVALLVDHMHSIPVCVLGCDAN